MSSGDDLKSSAHVWGGTNGNSPPDSIPIPDAPPAYEHREPESSNSNNKNQSQSPSTLPARPSRRKSAPNGTNRDAYHPIHAISKWATVPWTRYVVPDASVSTDRTTITTTHNLYTSNHAALVKLLTEQAELPPIPTLRLTGSHITSSGSSTVDFDVTLNLSTLVDLHKAASTPRWRNRPAITTAASSSSADARVRTVMGSNAAQIDAQARQFIRDKADRKSFVFTRCIEELPTDVIEGLVRNLMASLHYRGKLLVTFSVQCGQFVVQKKPAGAGAAVGGWFMNVLGLSPDVKYEMLERVWELGSSSASSSSPSAVSSGAEPGDVDGEDGASGDAGVLLREWWAAWSPAVRDAVLLKRKGKVGIEDWMEAQMGWRPVLTNREWGVDFVS